MAPLGRGDSQVLSALTLVVPATTTAGANANHVDRAMADVVVGIANKILCGKLPVTRYVPLLDTSQNLRAALSAIPAVQEDVQIGLHIAEILQERRRLLVPRGPQ